jgi:hypothetical protein
MMLGALDATGKVMIGVTILAVVAAIVAFYFISKNGPRGLLLGVAVALYGVSWCIPPEHSRELHLLIGILRICGFIGGILGLIDLFRKRGVPNKP